jgi:hypothetical protein
MEQIKHFFADLLTENPHYLGLFFVLAGIGGLITAITDANWLFGNVNKLDYNLKKYDGWINWFGRKGRIAARIHLGVGSVIAILGGLFWFWVYGLYF